MKKNIYRLMLVAGGVLTSHLASAAIDSQKLQTAADGFMDDILAGTAIVGLVMLGAAFGSIVWNWLKAAIFS